MAVDKLVDSTQLDADLTSVANAIRTKGGTSAQMAFPSGFVSAVQAIPTGITPTGTKQISITQNGTTTEDVTNYASAEITVSVPNTYSAGDEGKVVSNGALVSQTSDTVTTNNTYDTTLINSLTVNVSGGGGDSVAAVMKTIGNECFRYVELPETLIFPNATRLDARCFGGATGLKTLVLPVVNTMVTYPLADNTVIQTIDFGAGTPTFDNYTFSGDSSLTTLILRKTSGVIALGNVSAFSNSPFRSGGSGGTIYVPSSLISTYQSATNWSTINGYGTITWKAIEGSEYETHYADGTVIS